MCIMCPDGNQQNKSPSTLGPPGCGCDCKHCCMVHCGSLWRRAVPQYEPLRLPAPSPCALLANTSSTSTSSSGRLVTAMMIAVGVHRHRRLAVGSSE